MQISLNLLRRFFNLIGDTNSMNIIYYISCYDADEILPKHQYISEV